MKCNCLITLCDVITSQDLATGERTKQVSRISKVFGEIAQVGMTTFWNATANNVELSKVFYIRARTYNNQKYIYAEHTLYEVYSTGKGESALDISINAKRVNDDSLKETIEHALGVI